MMLVRHLTALLVTTGLLVSVSPVVTHATSPVSTPMNVAKCGSGVSGDIDGDGDGELVVSALRYGSTPSSFDVIGWPHAGRTPVGIPQLDSDAEERLTLRAGVLADLDGDGCTDAVFAGDIPDPSVTPLGESNYHPRIYVVPGSASGLNLAGTVRINLPGGEVRTLAALAATGQIAITTTAKSGGSLVVHTMAAGLTAGTTKQVTAASLRIRPSRARPDFGWSMAASGKTIVVGSPEEQNGKLRSGGAVYVFSATTLKYLRLTAKSKRMPKVSSYNSRFATAVAYLDGRLAIGASHSAVGNKNDAGWVYLLRWSESKRTYKVLRVFSQGSKKVPGAVHNWDMFANTLALTRGLTGAGSYDLAIGAWGDRVGKSSQAGSLTLTNFDTGGYQLVHQNSPGVPGAVKRGRQFSAYLLVQHLTPAKDSLLVSSWEPDPECPEAYLLAIRSAGPSRTSTWSTLSAKDPILGCSYR